MNILMVLTSHDTPDTQTEGTQRFRADPAAQTVLAHTLKLGEALD